MEPLVFQGDAFSEYFVTQLMWDEPRLRGRLGEGTAAKAFPAAGRALRDGQRALRERQQARSTRTLLVNPLAKLLGWRLGGEERLETLEGEEDAGAPLLGEDGETLARIRALPPDVAFDLPPAGRHRRFAPALSLIRVLERENLAWGILINAYELRLLRRTEGFVASWIAFDLGAIADGGDAGRKAWNVLWALLRDEALAAAPPVLEEVMALGREHAARVGAGLGAQVQEALVAFVQGILDEPANRNALPPARARGDLERLYAESLRVLYRLLFILYGEARGLLPLDMPTYREGYSLSRLARFAAGAATDPRRVGATGTFLEDGLRGLFALVRSGANLGAEGRIPAYGGGLFDAEATRLVDSLRWGEATVATVLDHLTFLQTPRGKLRVSYRELDVEQLGSIYEGLLEKTLDVAAGPMWLVRLDDREVHVTAAQRAELARRRGEMGAPAVGEPDEVDEEAGEGEADEGEEGEAAEGEGDEEAEAKPERPPHRKPIRILAGPIPAGRVFLRGGARRKQTGTFYTNRAFVDFLVRRAMDPLAEGKSPDEILALKVCDAAMGSGHFLVGACRRLAEHLLAAYRERGLEEAHPEVARVWDEEERALAACRLLVAGNCLYGVDKNPLAVELARVSLWLATAAADHPLTFLDHRLRTGDSLLGLPLYLGEGPEPPVHVLQSVRVRAPARGRRRRAAEAQVGLEPGADTLEIATQATRNLRERLRRAFNELETIRQLVEENPGDFAGQRAAFAAMQGELEPFAALHALRVGLALERDPQSPQAKGLLDAWLRDLGKGVPPPSIQEHATGALGAAAFCWPLAFPEVFFEPLENGQGVRPRARAGFDAMIGNPPWDKIKPAKKEFFAAVDSAIRDYQGQSLNRRIAELVQAEPGLAQEWAAYEAREKQYAAVLRNGGIYHHQIVEIQGEKTGGDPDLFKFFLERNHQLVSDGGRVGMLLPAGLCAVEGCTGLRRMLFEGTRVESLYSFENHLERFFPGVDSRQKFVTLVFAKARPDDSGFLAAFMLRDERFLALSPEQQEKRAVRITPEFLRLTSPDYLALVEVKDAREQAMVERIYRTIPPLGRKIEGTWNVSFTRELDMSNDSYLFRTREWLRAHGCALFLNGRKLEGPDDAEFPVPRPGGQYWVAPARDWYDRQPARFARVSRYVLREGSRIQILLEEPPREAGGRGRRGGRQARREVQAFEGYVPTADRGNPNALPVRPGATYVPLYEGRMVHQFDHAAKAYVSGEGRGARWDELSFAQKALVPHFFIDNDPLAGAPGPLPYRAGFCDVTGQTNERSVLSAIVPAGHPAGNSVPTVGIAGNDPSLHLFWVGGATSFVAEFLMRQKISTHLNFFYLEAWPLPRLEPTSASFQRLVELGARLSCFTPEMGELLNEVARRVHLKQVRPATDLRERAQLRAEIDAIVADLYGLSVVEFAYILTAFPLLDRDQPPLPGDYYVRWGPRGQAKPEPRSYITRDLALLTFIRRKGATPPKDLADFYRDEVELDFDSPQSAFRLGPIRDLETRVEEAHRRGAIAYVPSQAKRFNPAGPYRPPDLQANWEDMIIQDPGICGGAPALKGTRVEVGLVTTLLEQGRTFADILTAHPHLTPAHVAGALHWSRLGR